MKRRTLLAIAVCLLLAATIGIHAQSIKTIYSFTNGPANPSGGLILGPDGNFYGTSDAGGNGGMNGGYGTVYRVTTNGAWTILANFNNTNGAYPAGGLALGLDGNFYGTTPDGGSNGYGTVFRVTTNGVLTTLLSFNATNGSHPVAPLTLGSDGDFYGTSSGNYGTVFKITTNGVLTTLSNFNNTNGANPNAGLTLGPDGNFYGTTVGGGNSGDGTVFQVTSNGALLTLTNFNSTNGAYPYYALTLGPDGNLYGTTTSGGSLGYGTIFKVTTNSTLTILANISIGYVNSSLSLGADGNFYCSASSGTTNLIVKITTNGALTRLTGFLAGSVGTVDSLVLGPDGNFYGTTAGGVIGESSATSYGSVFCVATNGVLSTLVNFPGLAGGVPDTLTLGPDGKFYGASYAGTNVNGTILQITTNGTVNILAAFGGTNGAGPGNLTLGIDGNFYGATYSGGGYGDGAIFKITTNGSLTCLASFNGVNGIIPDYPASETIFESSLVQGKDGAFYGTAYEGGSGGFGNVFKVTTNGTLSALASFNYTSGGYAGTGLALGPDGNFYGTTQQGGSHGDGSVFKITTNGILTSLVSFNGNYPSGGLTLGSDGNFYGTTYGVQYLSRFGTVFKVTTNGTLTTLATLSSANPSGVLTLGPDGSLYGTTYGNLSGPLSSFDYGTVFKVATNGTLTTLLSFDYANGANPAGGLTLGLDGNLYGTTSSGGGGFGGTIFQLQLPPDFATPPANQTVIIGNRAIFNSQPFGTGPFIYQWLSNGIPILGATNASLTISPVLASEAGAFQVQVLNNSGSITSQPVSMNVVQQPNNYGVTASGGNCTVYLASYPQSTNRLWASTDLIRWQVIATNLTDANGLSQYQDTNTTGLPRKYYRLSNP